MASLGLAISAGSVGEPPRGNRVPSWVRRVILKGLSNTPDERWPTLEALLEALRDDPAARSRRYAALGGGLLAVALLGWGAAAAMRPAPAPPPVCTGASEELARVWSEERAAAIDAAFDRTGLPYAGDAARTVRRSLDEWGSQWAAMHREACEATRVQGSQSERMLDRRMACLKGRLDGVEAVLDLLEQGDAAAVEGAVEAVTALPSVEGCADLEALERGLEPPEDPAVAAEVDEVRALLRRARAAERAGSATRARELADQGLARAESSGYAPVRAEAELVAGLVALEAGDYPTAETQLSAAYFRAIQQGHETVAADAAAHLVYLIGYRRQDVERGLKWLPHAEALALRTDPGGLAEATMSHLSGAVLDGKGAHEEAERRYVRALEIRSQRLPADHPDTARTLNNLGNIEMGKGDYAKAEDYYGRARAMREALFGPAHPEVAGSLNNLSLTRRRAGDVDGAIDLLSRAVDIYEGAYGDHPDTAQAMNNLAINLIEKGELGRARSIAQDALRIRKKELGEEHPDLGDTELVLGQIHEAEGEHEAALALHRAALAHYEGSFDDDHPAVFEARVAVGRCQLALGQTEEAKKTLELALEQGGGGVSPDDVKAAKKLLAP